MELTIRKVKNGFTVTNSINDDLYIASSNYDVSTIVERTFRDYSLAMNGSLVEDI